MYPGPTFGTVNLRRWAAAVPCCWLTCHVARDGLEELVALYPVSGVELGAGWGDSDLCHILFAVVHTCAASWK